MKTAEQLLVDPTPHPADPGFTTHVGLLGDVTRVRNRSETPKAKTLDSVRADIVATMRMQFGPALDLSNTSIMGRVASILAEQELRLWEIIESWQIK